METFESFDALFKKVIYFEVIKTAEGKHKDVLNSINQTYYEWEFSIWLKNKKSFNPEKDSIQPYLTKDNWIEFYREHSKKANAAHAEYLKEQADWEKKIYAEEPLSENQVPQMLGLPPNKQMEKGKSGLTMAEFALMCFYEYDVSKDGKKWKIDIDPVGFASKEGWISPNSGKALAQWSNDVQKPEERTGQTDNTKRELNIKRKRIEKVIPLLTENAKLKADVDLELVKNLIKEQSI